ncbi:MAG: GIY-YIG nuclease family protein, partial [Bacteroidales bacterium]|nr:GIY-YIG nuclease family protein [Bacteroidales bacterium]
VGQTANPTSRLREHNSGRSKYTRNKGPWEMIFLKDFPSRIEAVNFEKKLKALKSPGCIRKLIISGSVG